MHVWSLNRVLLFNLLSNEFVLWFSGRIQGFGRRGDTENMQARLPCNLHQEMVVDEELMSNLQSFGCGG